MSILSTVNRAGNILTPYGNTADSGNEVRWSANNGVLAPYNQYLTAGWKFSNGSLLVDSVGSNTLTNNNAVGSVAGGKSGYGAEFNGTDTYLSTSTNSALLPAVSLALSFWFEPDGATDEQYFFRCTAGNYLVEYYSTNSFAAALWQSDNAQKTLSTTQVFSAGQYYHVMMIANGSKLRAYVNSSEIGTEVEYNGSISQDSGTASIGANHDGGSPVDGVLDEVMLWSDILFADDAAEVAFVVALYNSTNGAFYEV